MMLMRRSTSPQKDRRMSSSMHDSISESSYFHSNRSSQKSKSISFLNVLGLFVGFNPWSFESDSVRSPTSTLDFRIFSSFGNPFRCPKSQNEDQKKSWDRSKVGLSIVEFLSDGTKRSEKCSAGLSGNKNIIFGRKMSVKNPNFVSHVNAIVAPKSLPKNVASFSSSITRSKPIPVQSGTSSVVFEIGDENFRARSLDSGKYGSDFFTNHPKSRFFEPSESKFLEGSLKLSPIPPLKPINPSSVLVDSISASEIKNSEDYTRVITHGPNPKVTHIFADCVLERRGNFTCFVKKNEANILKQEADQLSDVLGSYSTEDDFLKFCYSCKKILDGEDIYMYRGEKAFCSHSCRLMEIDTDGETDIINNPPSETFENSNSFGEISTSESGSVTTT